MRIYSVANYYKTDSKIKKTANLQTIVGQMKDNKG
jgi:hypothetical protein